MKKLIRATFMFIVSASLLSCSSVSEKEEKKKTPNRLPQGIEYMLNK